MPDDNQAHDRKATVTESKMQPPDPVQVAAAQTAVKSQAVRPSAEALRAMQAEAGVLDTTPDKEPYRTDDAKTSLAEVTLIGGYIHIDQKTGERRLLNKAVMREISGHEEDMLTDTKIELSRRFQNILAACLERIGDGKGLWITDPELMHGIVDELPIGDRAQLLYHLRIISVYPDPENYTFRVNCDNCGNEIRHTENLVKAKIVPMKNPMERLYDKTLPSGKTVRCRIMLGRHERIVDEARQLGQNQLSAAIIARVLEINGQPATMSKVKDLSKRDRDFLRQMFDDVEGGVDTTTQIRCGGCGSRFEGEIDISQRDFFFPSGKLKN